jgi:hypothetical protein
MILPSQTKNGLNLKSQNLKNRILDQTIFTTKASNGEQD